MNQPPEVATATQPFCFCPLCGSESKFDADPNKRPPVGSYGVCNSCGQIVRYVALPWFEAVSEFELTRVPQDQFEKIMVARNKIQEAKARQQRAH